MPATHSHSTQAWVRGVPQPLGTWELSTLQAGNICIGGALAQPQDRQRGQPFQAAHLRERVELPTLEKRAQKGLSPGI